MATNVNRRPQGRDEVVDAVLDAAERLFAEQGPANVSLRAIAQDAGVNYGLVHRHFGTKDDLLDRLLERYAERWNARVEERSLDYLGALEELLGPRTESPETGAYMRLLAWTLLSSGSPAETHRRHITLDRLPTLGGVQDSGDSVNATAAALAFVFGWRFFRPFIEDALHLEHGDTEVHESIRARLRQLVEPL